MDCRPAGTGSWWQDWMSHCHQCCIVRDRQKQLPCKGGRGSSRRPVWETPEGFLIRLLVQEGWLGLGGYNLRALGRGCLWV